MVQSQIIVGCMLFFPLHLTRSFELKVMSYNLYGWNALVQNPWKAVNMFNKVKQYAPDMMGSQEVEGQAGWIVQETGDPNTGHFGVVASHAGHAIFYRSSLFNVEAEGFFDINEMDH